MKCSNPGTLLRVTPDIYEQVAKIPLKHGSIQYYEAANIISMTPSRIVGPAHSHNGEQTPTMKKHVAVVTAGTTDLPIAEEVCITLESSGCGVVRVVDVGVAGLHRIITALPTLRSSTIGCIIVCAGMDGALPSVVGGCKFSSFILSFIRVAVRFVD